MPATSCRSAVRSVICLSYLDTSRLCCLTNLNGLTGRCKSLAFADLFAILEQMTKRDQLGNFELMVILALIRLGDNAYGVPISEELEKRTGRDVAIGSVYAALERLEDKGFVASELSEATPERGGRAKRYFRVTARGLKEVRETQRALVKLWNGLPELEGGKA
jgi:DNA-binding PadR family transcriptional regulator